MITDDLRRWLDETAHSRPWYFVEPNGINGEPDGLPIALVAGLHSQRHKRAALITGAINALSALLDVVEAARDLADEDALDPGGTTETWDRLYAALARLEAE